MDVISDQQGGDDQTLAALNYREGRNFYGLLIKTSLLTFFTLGLYRFWQTAALRRYYWSSIAIDGDSLEYSGTGVETFVGFLFALVIAAVYLGIFVVAGSFAGLVIFENLTVIQIFAIGAFVPIFYFARYRFRRYLFSRTIWRGIRFGLAKGAWGYVWRGIAFLILTVLSLGLLEPFGRYHLEKYVNDRARIGNQFMQLGGSWRGIYRYFVPLYICVVVLALLVGYNYVQHTVFEGFASYIVLGLFVVAAYGYYVVRSQQYFMNYRSIGETVRFKGSFRTRSVLGRYVIGYGFAIFSAFITFYIAFILLAIIASGIFAANYIGYSGFEIFERLVEGEQDLSTYDTIVLVIGAALVYLGALLAFEITRQVFVTQPVAKYVARNVQVGSLAALGTIGQGDVDDIRDADGLADALDVGFGF